MQKGYEFGRQRHPCVTDRRERDVLSIPPRKSYRKVWADRTLYGRTGGEMRFLPLPHISLRVERVGIEAI